MYVQEGLKDQWPQSEMSVRLVIETVQMEGYGCFRFFFPPQNAAVKLILKLLALCVVN